MNVLILVTPDWKKPFILQVDASYFKIEGTLTQEGKSGRTKVVAYTSKKLNLSVESYATNDLGSRLWANNLGLIALVTGLQRFWWYLEGATLPVATNNQVISHFLSKPNPSRREAWWMEVLEDFSISTLKLKAGKINVLGDALSRIRHAQNSRVEQSHMDIVTIVEDDVLLLKLKAYNDDQAFGTLFRSFNEVWPNKLKQIRRVKLLKPLLCSKDHKLMYEGSVCAPRKAVRDVNELAHES